jgi:hypothetical protein
VSSCFDLVYVFVLFAMLMLLMFCFVVPAAGLSLSVCFGLLVNMFWYCYVVVLLFHFSDCHVVVVAFVCWWLECCM